MGVVFGGRSGEHEVSVRSAKSIREILDARYKILDIKIGKDGKFDEELIKKSDVIFPIVHGTYGEDGCLQGFLEMFDKAYVGAGVLGSAVGMDKDVQKRLLNHAGIPVAKFQVLHKIQDTFAQRAKLNIQLNYPLYVKPVNMGSSVGVSRVVSHEQLAVSLKEAFKYDTKVIIEEEVKGRELEVSVLGNDDPMASVPGEVITKNHEFYDYEAKYVDENGASLRIPAELTKEQVSKIQKMAIKTFKVLECSGMARVDMFLRPNGQLVINEINSLPGFTSISMYPKLWEASGLSYPKLLDRLIELALEKKKQKDKLKRSYN